MSEAATASGSTQAVTQAWYDGRRNLVEMFFDRADALPNKPVLFGKRDGAWRAFTFAEAAGQVRQLAAALADLGVQPGDRVVLVSENRPEWPIVDLAIMACGGVTTPAYTTNTVEDHIHILTDSGAVGVIYSTPKIAASLLPATDKADGLKFIVAIEPPGDPEAAKRKPHTLAELLARGDHLLQAGSDPAADWAGRLTRPETACIIYTSGTGGAPKGVMLSHGAILCNCKGAHWLLEQFGLEDEVFLSFLPLSHSYEHTAGQFFPLAIGAQIYYAESVEKLTSNLTEVRPTVMTAVPRLYESMHARITAGVTRAGGVKAKLFDKAVAIGRKRYEAPHSLTLADRMMDRLLDKLVRTKVADRFGGRLKGLVSGGAPLNYEIGVFFHALGLRLLQGYGQTESAPVVSCNPPQKTKIHTVGRILPDVEVKIAGDGEILVRGELVMNGYWNRPDETAQTVKDGWLHTGDIGLIDEDGYLQITDRKKDIIVLSGGDNVAPQRVEGFLTLQPEISQAMVYGDKRPHLVALLVPDPDWLKSWAAEHGKDTADGGALTEDKELRATLQEAVKRVNAELSQLERVRTFAIAPAPFSIDNNMLTPTMKIRRHVIREAYGSVLEALY